MSRRASLSAFLTTARNALKAPAAQRPTPLTFVVGNESADLDSLCSAIVYAYIRTHSPPHSLHIPLSNLPRADLGLRTEMIAVLEHAGLGPLDLLTLSELPELRPEDTRWVLVDHNSLTGQLKKFAGQVIGCVDHHVDEDALSKDISPRVIEPCGSCMSLVIDECKEAWSNLPKDGGTSSSPDEDDKLVKLSLAPILLDTINLTAKEKVRPKDPQAVFFLESQVQQPDFDRTKYYDQINAVKEDISSLGFRDIFRKDYKEWEQSDLTLGVSCVVQGFEYLLGKAKDTDTFLTELSSWSKERNLDVAAVMTTSNPDGKFQRQLLVWGMSEKGKVAVEKFREIGARLQLETWNGGALDDAGNTRFAWRQYDLAASRKRVAPLLREALRAI